MKVLLFIHILYSLTVSNPVRSWIFYNLPMPVRHGRTPRNMPRSTDDMLMAAFINTGFCMREIMLMHKNLFVYCCSMTWMNMRHNMRIYICVYIVLSGIINWRILLGRGNMRRAKHRFALSMLIVMVAMIVIIHGKYNTLSLSFGFYLQRQHM